MTTLYLLSLVLVFHLPHVEMFTKSYFAPFSHSPTETHRDKPNEYGHRNSSFTSSLSSSSFSPTDTKGVPMTGLFSRSLEIHTKKPTASSTLANSGSRILSNNLVRSSSADLMVTSSSLRPSPSPPVGAQTRKKSLSSFVSYSGKFPKEAQRDPTSLHSVGEVNVLDALPESDLLLKLDRNYTPKEIAEYIASTGDEKGIIQVIAEMVQDGQIMASRDDVILFLEAVQRELDKEGSLNSEQISRPFNPPKSERKPAPIL